MLDLEQFASLDAALDELAASSTIYEEVPSEVLGNEIQITLLTMFAMSMCTRLRGLHESIVREARASNPHAVFPLSRALAETLLTIAYVQDHPDYIERIMRRRGEQPKELKRLPISELISHITPNAPGFSRVYDELCEITHVGMLALWQPHAVVGDRETNWSSAPRWKNDREGLVACAQLKELSEAAAQYLRLFVQTRCSP